jgi:hypothetical protein
LAFTDRIKELKNMTSVLSLNEISTLDKQIELLYDYKPIAENEVKNLCDKVSLTSQEGAPSGGMDEF